VTDKEKAMLEGLRKLRLHHWQTALKLRAYGQTPGMRKSDTKHYDKKADFHLTQVQLLNNFFPIGDTAEKDDNAKPKD